MNRGARLTELELPSWSLEVSGVASVLQRTLPHAHGLSVVYVCQQFPSCEGTFRMSRWLLQGQFALRIYETPRRDTFVVTAHAAAFEQAMRAFTETTLDVTGLSRTDFEMLTRDASYVGGYPRLALGDVARCEDCDLPLAHLLHIAHAHWIGLSLFGCPNHAHASAAYHYAP